MINGRGPLNDRQIQLTWCQAFENAWELVRRHYNNSVEAFSTHVQRNFLSETIIRKDSKNALESIGIIESGVVNIKGMLNDVSAIDHAAVFWFHSWMWTLTNSGEYFELTLISCLRWSPSPLIIVRRLRLGTKLWMRNKESEIRKVGALWDVF